jgi:hypothetical protein
MSDPQFADMQAAAQAEEAAGASAAAREAAAEVERRAVEQAAQLPPNDPTFDDSEPLPPVIEHYEAPDQG